MDASLKGLGAVLSQKGDDNTVWVIAYASRSLRLGEKSMRNFSSGKIELLALKWSICKKFKDYLLVSKFTVYTDNNPLVYVKTSKLGAAQIRWLSELALYDFNIIYECAKATWLLMHYPGDQNHQNLLTTIQNKTVMMNGKRCHIQLHHGVQLWWSSDYLKWSSFRRIYIGSGWMKIGADLRECIEMIGSAHDELGETEPIEIHSNLVEVFSHITPEDGCISKGE